MKPPIGWSNTFRTQSQQFIASEFYDIVCNLRKILLIQLINIHNFKKF